MISDLRQHVYDRLTELGIPAHASLAIAFSGGGDSTALLHGLKDHPQVKYVFIVDHGLRHTSQNEAKTAEKLARELGYQARILNWQHDNPSSGLQEKARKARYSLLGQACRDAGVTHLLTAHTEDDQAETLLMRYERDTGWRGAAGMANMSYAPLWPELAGVHLCRPLLDVRRAVLRSYNRKHGLSWGEDPSNENRAFTRIRARDDLRDHPYLHDLLLAPASELREGIDHENMLFFKWLNEYAEVNSNGYILCKSIPPLAFLARVLRVAGGSGGATDWTVLSSFRQSFFSHNFSAATLWGARVKLLSGGAERLLLFTRDPVAVKGRQGQPARLRSQTLKEGRHIWDGRFEITVKRGGYMILPAYMCKMAELHEYDNGIAHVPASARPTLPIITTDGGAITCVGAGEADDLVVKSLMSARLNEGIT